MKKYLLIPALGLLVLSSCVNRAGQIQVNNPGLPFSSLSKEVPTAETAGTHGGDEHDAD